MSTEALQRPAVASEAIPADVAERRTLRAALNYLRAKWDAAPALRATPDGQAEWDRIHRLLDRLQ